VLTYEDAGTTVLGVHLVGIIAEPSDWPGGLAVTEPDEEQDR